MLFLLLGLSFGLWVVNLVPTDTPDHPAFVFLTGVIAISAMIPSDYSGSCLLLIMRKYDYLLSNINLMLTEDLVKGFLNIIPFTLGSIVGVHFLGFYRGYYIRFHSQTIAVLIGFMVGSLFVIWPYQHRDYIEQVRGTEC